MKKVCTPWFAQSRFVDTGLACRPRFIGFDEVFDFLCDFYSDKYDIHFALVRGHCPMSSAVFTDRQPFISIDCDMRYPEPYLQADFTLAIPSKYGGYANGRFVSPLGYHTEFYLIPRNRV